MVDKKITQIKPGQDLNLKNGNFKSNESEATGAEVVDLGETVIRNTGMSEINSNFLLKKAFVQNFKTKKADYTFQYDEYGIFADTRSYSVSSITRVGSEATVTTTTANNVSIGELIAIDGADQSEYNGIHEVTDVISTTVFKFTVSGTPASPATGTITLGGLFDLFLPLSDDVDIGMIKYAKNIGDNQVLVKSSGSDTIDGGTVVILDPAADYEFVNAGNGNWYKKA